MTHRAEVVEMMYWCKDKSWYVFDPSFDYKYRLTENAPERAQKAYNDWLKSQKESI